MGRRVLLVDDHPGFRRMARLLLERGGYTVVAEAGSASEALAEAAGVDADLVLLDVLLPDQDGIDLSSVLALLPRPPQVVLVSSRSAHELGPRLAAAPVCGFLRKDELTLDRLAALVR